MADVFHLLLLGARVVMVGCQCVGRCRNWGGAGHTESYSYLVTSPRLLSSVSPQAFTQGGDVDHHHMGVRTAGDDRRHPLGVNGLEAETLLNSLGLVTNKNMIPYDQLPPSCGSGLRIGSPTMTPGAPRRRRWNTSAICWARL